MTRTVPSSPMTAPPEFQPIFTSVYCALSWSSSETAGRSCAPTRHGAIPTIIKAATSTEILIFSRMAIFLRRKSYSDSTPDPAFSRGFPSITATFEVPGDSALNAFELGNGLNKTAEPDSAPPSTPDMAVAYCVAVLTASPVLKPVPETTEHAEETSSPSVTFTNPIDVLMRPPPPP